MTPNWSYLSVPSFLCSATSQVTSAASTVLSFAKNLVYTQEDPVATAEDQFLRCRYYVELDNGCKIWTLSSVPYGSIDSLAREKRKETSVILVHGLLSGLAYWAMNFDTIVDSGHDLYAFDLPGFSRSSRINFSEDGETTEKMFLDILHQWRQKLNLKEVILVGHSFGGYICTLYSLHYPENIIQVILVDPWGFPDIREEVTALVESGDIDSFYTPLYYLPVWIRIVVMVLMPFSPFSFLRLCGRFLGPKIIHILRPDMTRRYARIFGDDDLFTVPQYIFHSNNSLPTGEHAFRSMAMPLAWAKRPLIKRLFDWKPDIDLTFIYGSRSWIDFQTGIEVKRILNNTCVNVFVIEGAGHHIFADEPDKFNELIERILEGKDTSELSSVVSSESEASSFCIKDVPMH